MHVLLMIVLLAAEAPAVETPAPAQDSTTIVVKGKKEKKVCKTIDPNTGSRIGIQRICRSAAEWKMSEEQSQRIIEKGQDRQRAVNAYDQNAKNGLAKQGPK